MRLTLVSQILHHEFHIGDEPPATDLTTVVPASEQQQKIPGLIGMASVTNGAYLRAMQSYVPATGPANRPFNRLRTILYEIDFSELVRNVRTMHWPEAEGQIAEAASALKAAGAEFLVITSNTGSTLAQRAAAESRLPILDIVEPALTAVLDAGRKNAGLLSTRRTLESNVYQRAARAHGLSFVPPPAKIIQRVEEIIFDELVFGEATPHGLEVIAGACDGLAQQGADAVILGCTDMTHLADQLRAGTSLFVADTTQIHASAAAQVCWSGSMDPALFTLARE
jgi:aspartate racemase